MTLLKFLPADVDEATVYKFPAHLLEESDEAYEKTEIDDPNTPWRKTAHYVNLNERLMREAARNRLQLYIDPETRKLTTQGEQFVAKTRTIKCKRERCDHNLGRRWRQDGRKVFAEAVDRSDVEVLREYCDFTFEQIRPLNSWNDDVTTDFKSEVRAQGRKFFVAVKHSTEEYARKGYCCVSCDEIDERGAARRGIEVPKQLAKLMKELGFQRSKPSDTKGYANFYGGPNNTYVKLVGSEITLTGFGPGTQGRPTTVKLGTFHLDQMDALRTAIYRAKSREEIEKELIDLNAPTEAEKEALRELIAVTKARIEALEMKMVGLRTALKVGSAITERVVERVAELHELSEARIALNRLMHSAQRRLEGGHFATPENTPLPMFLTDKQREIAARDADFRSRELFLSGTETVEETLGVNS